MEIDLPEVIVEVKTEFERYAALYCCVGPCARSFGAAKPA
jgi:hypothetical protein